MRRIGAFNIRQIISISVLNGPNLDTLGIREPDVYGNETPAHLEKTLTEHAGKLGCGIAFGQYNTQGELVSAVNAASGKAQGLVINPGGFSHTSVAVLDSMRAFQGPVVEVHISPIHSREPFRHRMLTAQGADAVISGAGTRGYLSAIEIILELLRR